jgi:hypothetical protein
VLRDTSTAEEFEQVRVAQKDVNSYDDSARPERICENEIAATFTHANFAYGFGILFLNERNESQKLFRVLTNSNVALRKVEQLLGGMAVLKPPIPGLSFLSHHETPPVVCVHHFSL